MKLKTDLPLVVLTYPGHFLLTTLTIQSYFQHHAPVPTTVIVDDTSNRCWSGYLEDCQRQYSGCNIITVSSLHTATLFKTPWIRQQIIKLYLDMLLPFDQWFFTDGDIEYYFPAPTNAIPYTITRGGPVQDQQNNYVSYLLGIDDPATYAEHPHMDWDPMTRRHQVCVSNPPFRTMQASTLIQLRNYVERLHDKTLIELHLHLNNIDYLVSEWELLASYQNNILEQNVELVYYPTVPLDKELVLVPDQPDFCGTCYTSDSAYSRQWWQTKGIQVSDRIWQEVVNISK